MHKCIAEPYQSQVMHRHITAIIGNATNAGNRRILVCFPVTHSFDWILFTKYIQTSLLSDICLALVRMLQNSKLLNCAKVFLIICVTLWYQAEIVLDMHSAHNAYDAYDAYDAIALVEHMLTKLHWFERCIWFASKRRSVVCNALPTIVSHWELPIQVWFPSAQHFLNSTKITIDFIQWISA